MTEKIPANAFSEKNKKDIRLKHLKRILENYQTEYPEISSKYKFSISLEHLNIMYWNLVNDSVKKHFEDSGSDFAIDRHKILSTLEFTIMGLSPWRRNNADAMELQRINAHFTVFVSWDFYVGFYIERYKASPRNFDNIKFLEEHKLFLMFQKIKLIKGKTPPKLLSNMIFSNAATWYGFDLYIQAKDKKI